MYNIQDETIPYNNGVRPVRCEGWHFTHMWKAHARPHHFTKRDLGLYNYFNPAISVLSQGASRCIRLKGIDSDSFYDFSIGF